MKNWNPNFPSQIAYEPASSKWPFDSPNGGHLSFEKVTYGSKRGHFEEPGKRMKKMVRTKTSCWPWSVACSWWQNVFVCILDIPLNRDIHKKTLVTQWPIWTHPGSIFFGLKNSSWASFLCQNLEFRDGQSKTGQFQWKVLWKLAILVYIHYPWTPKPWKMKVLQPQYMGYNP